MNLFGLKRAKSLLATGLLLLAMGRAYSQQPTRITITPDAPGPVTVETAVTVQDGRFRALLPAPPGDVGLVHRRIAVRGAATDATSGKTVRSDTFGDVTGLAGGFVTARSPDGNITADGRRTALSWSPSGRLLAVSMSDGRHVEDTYDAGSRRIRRKVFDAYNRLVSDRKTLWSGWTPLVETESDGTGVLLHTRRYLWGADLDGSVGGMGHVGGLLALEYDGHLYAPAYDASGHVIGLLDGDNGNVVARYEYGPFGEPLRESGPAKDVCPFRWNTRYWDVDTGLYYFGYRYYDPMTGRWLSREPLGEGAALNLYAYCGGDPVNNFDYLGLEPVSNDQIWAAYDNLFPYGKGTRGYAADLKRAFYLSDGSLKSDSLWLKSLRGYSRVSDRSITLDSGLNARQAAEEVFFALNKLRDGSGPVAEHYLGMQTGSAFNAAFMSWNDTQFREGMVKIQDAINDGAMVTGTINPVVMGTYVVGEATRGNFKPVVGLAGGVVATKVASMGAGVMFAGVRGAVQSEAAAADEILLQSYGGPGRGHHIPAKSAFNGALGYDINTALAIPNAELRRLNLFHPTITGAQQTLYRNFAKTGSPLTWEVLQSIETQALVKAGAPEDAASAAVMKAIQALKESGVSGPTQIPWGN